jgi:hypothetical protein
MRAPIACCRAISNGRGSMVASSWPFFTICPSVKAIEVSTPETWGRTVTVIDGTTVPSASSTTGRSARVAVAMPTVLAPTGCRGPSAGSARAARSGPAAPDAPEPAAMAANGPPAGRGGRCVRYQASAPRATSATIATTAPSQRRRGGTTRTSAGEGSSCGSDRMRSAREAGKASKTRPDSAAPDGSRAAEQTACSAPAPLVDGGRAGKSDVDAGFWRETILYRPVEAFTPH